MSNVAEESVIAQVQSMICDAMKRAKISRAELARRIGCSRSLITRFLQGDANPSVRTVAKLLDSCGYDIEVRLLERKP